MLSPAQIQTIKASVQPSSSGGGMGAGSPPMTPEQAKASFTGIPTSPAPRMPAQSTSSPVGDFVSSIPSAVGSLAKTSIQNTKNQQQSSFNAVGSDVSNAADSITAAGQDLGNNNVGGALKNTGKAVLQGGLGTVSDAISYFLAPLSGTVKTVTDTVAGNNPNAKGLSDIPSVQNLANSSAGDAISSAQDALTKAAQSHPVLAKAITDAFNVAMTGAGGGEAPKAVEQLGSGISKDISTVGSGIKAGANEVSNIASDVGTLAKNKVQSILPESKIAETPALNEKAVIDNYNRSIKPSIAGKATSAQLAKANSDTITGLKAIVENKPNLSFSNVDGEVVKGQTPSTLSEHLDAVAQTKGAIYDKYNALSKEAGEKGISVDTASIATELSSVINNKALKISNPEAVSYAQKLQGRLLNEGQVDAETAQQVIQNYNAELKAYYRNPTPGLASNVQIDAMIANRFRTQLDEGITNATGKQYQALKTQYGALSRMEAEATKRLQVFARQNKVGLADNISNIASGAELVRGLITANPVDMALSGGIKAIQLYEKYLNNPDTAIKNMYRQFNGTSPTPTVPTQSIEGKGIPSDKPATFVPKSQAGKMLRDASKNGTQGGFAKVPFSKAKPSNAEIGTLRDYTDYAHGSYNPSSKDGLQLETDAGEIMDKYGITTRSNPKSNSKEIARFLEKNNS